MRPILYDEITARSSCEFNERRTVTMQNLEIIVDVEKTVGKDFRLVDIFPVYKYEDKKRTDEIIGYKYDVVLPDRKFQHLTVKILGEKKMEIGNSDVSVVFTDLSLSLYPRDFGSYGVSSTATDVKAAKS